MEVEFVRIYRPMTKKGVYDLLLKKIIKNINKTFVKTLEIY